MKFSSKIERCELSPMRKYAPYANAARARGMRIFPLNIGQPDIETPTEFFDAVRNFSTPVLEYAPSDGVAEYLEAVRDYYHRIGHTDLTTANILATNGGSEALWMTMSTILDDGDEIIVPEPYYPNYSTFVTLAGGKTCPIPTTAEEGYHYANREKIEALINEHTRAIMITNPGNPTGAVLTREEMKMLAGLAHEHNLFLVADEVYREFSYDGEQMASMLEFPEAAENVIVIDSVSKRFSACGARIGAVISRNAEFLSEAMKVCQGRLCCPTLDQVGAAALYGVGSEYFAAVKDEYRRRLRDAHADPRRCLPQARGCVLPDGQAARGQHGRLPDLDAGALLRQRRHRHDNPGRGFLHHPRQGRQRGAPGLRAQARRPGARHARPRRGHRGLQQPLTAQNNAPRRPRAGARGLFVFTAFDPARRQTAPAACNPGNFVLLCKAEIPLNGGKP